MRYGCIDRHRKQYPVRMMCPALKVSRSGYYAWRSRPQSVRDSTDQTLTDAIRQIHRESRGVYGAPKICAALRTQGHHYGRHKIARLMRVAGLKVCPRRRYKVTTHSDPGHDKAPNLLKQNFSAEAPNQRWVSDITYIPTRQGWLYLAAVMDLYSRRIVGWSMSRWMNRRIVLAALRMAIGARQPEGALIHHSDRGSQYTSDSFRDELAKHGIQCSMSSAGNCYDCDYVAAA